MQGLINNSQQRVSRDISMCIRVLHTCFCYLFNQCILTLYPLMKIIHYSIVYYVWALLRLLPSLGVLIIMRNILTCIRKELTTLHSLENKVFSYSTHTLQRYLRFWNLGVQYISVNWLKLTESGQFGTNAAGLVYQPIAIDFSPHSDNGKVLLSFVL